MNLRYVIQIEELGVGKSVFANNMKNKYVTADDTKKNNDLYHQMALKILKILLSKILRRICHSI